jgi:replicative DNA helicase
MTEADVSDSVYIETQLKEFIQFSALQMFAISTVEDLSAKRYDPELPKKARAALEAGNIDEDFGHDYTRQIQSRIYNATTADHEPRVPTGITHLDRLIGGGLKAGELGILLGLPKGFKSGTMLNFAYSAMQVYNGLNVLYITLELDAELVGLRFDFRVAGRTKEQLIADPEKFMKVLRTRMDAGIGRNRLFIKQFRTKTATCDTLRTYIDRVQEHYGIKIGMVIVDYLDLMKATRKREKSYQEDVDICEDLRDIAIEYRIPIWTACRATREAVGKKRISMAHMSRAFERVG